MECNTNVKSRATFHTGSHRNWSHRAKRSGKPIRQLPPPEGDTKMAGSPLSFCVRNVVCLPWVVFSYRAPCFCHGCLSCFISDRQRSRPGAPEENQSEYARQKWQISARDSLLIIGREVFVSLSNLRCSCGCSCACHCPFSC